MQNFDEPRSIFPTLWDAASIRIFVVEDHEMWRRFYSTALRTRPELQIIGEVSDGLEAIEKARELKPDLILLDIGLPQLNGIEAVQQIREVSPASKVLFVSENRSVDIVEKALNTGAGGYLVKSDAGSQLLTAVEAVLQGKRFVSTSLAGHLVESAEDGSDNLQRKEAVTPFRVRKKVRHEVEFYADDKGFVDGFVRFIEEAFKEGHTVIVVATDSHHASLLQRLKADGLNMPGEIEQGNYIPLEVTRTLSNFIINDSPDPVLFRKVAGDLMTAAAKREKGENRRVAACGEGVHRLLAAGNLDATIACERLWNEVAELYQVDILCGYFRSDFAIEKDISTFERVCAEHSAAHGRELCY